MNQQNEQVKPEELREALNRVPVIVNVPLVHPAKFAELIGVSEGVVGGWVDRAYIPTVKIGRYLFVNLAQIQESSKTAGFVGGSIQ